MTKEEALKLALEALERCVATCFDRHAHEQVMSRPEHFVNQAITAIKDALAHDDADAIIIQYHEATIKWQEKRIEELTAQPEQEPLDFAYVMEAGDDRWKKLLIQERNFCQRCGKRTADLTTIHTCTPPKENK